MHVTWDGEEEYYDEDEGTEEGIPDEMVPHGDFDDRFFSHDENLR